jgi:hypothetical protein
MENDIPDELIDVFKLNPVTEKYLQNDKIQLIMLTHEDAWRYPIKKDFPLYNDILFCPEFEYMYKMVFNHPLLLSILTSHGKCTLCKHFIFMNDIVFRRKDGNCHYKCYNNKKLK